MRRRILLLVVGMTTLVVLAFAIPLTVLVRQNAYNSGVEGLRNEARSLSFAILQQQYNGSTITVAEVTTALARYGQHRSASVEMTSGQVLGNQPPGGSRAAPKPDTRPQPGAPGNTPPAPGGSRGGFEAPTQQYRGGQLVVTFLGGSFKGQDTTTDDTSRPILRVWASYGTLRSGQTVPLLVLIGGALLLLLIGVVAGEILTRRIVRPLLKTAGTAQLLSTGDTSARAPTDGPGEVAEVGLALNRLADRIDQLIAEERETTADLSHRLRTPMTALRLDAEGLRDSAEAERIGTHVTTLERMLTAVIHAARRPQREGRMPTADATAVVGERVEFWSALAEDQGRSVTIELPTHPVPVRAGEEDLAAAVDALLENVIAHTPEGTAFAVRLQPVDGGAELEVADEGPGLPEDAHVRGRSDRGSTGLGLDIARRSAESSGGSMTLASSATGGARVVLHLRAVS